MKRFLKRVVFAVFACLLVLCFAGCNSDSAKQSFDNEQSDPMRVAEGALNCLSGNDVDHFMEYSLYYESSLLYAELRSVAEQCTKDIKQIGDFEFLVGGEFDLDSLDYQVIEYLESDSIDMMTQAKEYSFKNMKTEDWIDIYVGKIDHKWYVWYMEYSN